MTSKCSVPRPAVQLAPDPCYHLHALRFTARPDACNDVIRLQSCLLVRHAAALDARYRSHPPYRRPSVHMAERSSTSAGEQGSVTDEPVAKVRLLVSRG